MTTRAGTGSSVARALRLTAVGVLFLLPIAVATAGYDLLRQRRELLLRNLEVEVTQSLNSIAGLVGEGARDLRTDLSVAARVLRHAERTDAETIDLVTTQLVALNRTQKHYLALWYVRDDAIVARVSGQRESPHLVPALAPNAVREVAAAAAERPGEVVRSKPAVADRGGYEHLRLFGLAPAPELGSLVVLVSLDRLFAALQGRARLPGTDLWVVDADGTVLVDPKDGERPPEVMRALGSEATFGTRILGTEPGLWPGWTTDRHSSLLAWRTNRSATFHWTTGLAVPLDLVVPDLHDLAWRVIILVTATLLVAVAVVIALAWLSGRQRRLAEQLEHVTQMSTLRDQLLRAEKLSTFGQIAAGVAHEIGTPLGVISIRLDQFLEHDEDPKRQERVRIMKEQIERISRIIRQLLDYSRPQDTGRTAVALRPAVERVTALVLPRLRRKQLDLVVEVPPETEVLANLDQLHQVLLNLLVNAADACEQGGRITVGSRAHPENPKLVGIEVRDNGPGVPPDQRDAIFEPFVTSKPPGEGTGLGLTIVKDIIESHGGSVELTGDAPETTFTTWWPRAAATLNVAGDGAAASSQPNTAEATP